MARLEVIDRDVGFTKLVNELQWLEGKNVTIGWQGKSALDQPGESDATIVDIATFQEFGTVTIPSRPMLRSTFDTKAKEIEDFIAKELDKVIQLEQTAKQALNRIGLKAVALVQQRIKDSPSWAVPLAPATIAAKGSSVPLVDSGRMRASVTYAIRHGNQIIFESEAA